MNPGDDAGASGATSAAQDRVGADELARAVGGGDAAPHPGPVGVLLCTYGSPAEADDVARYLEHITGREPTEAQVEELAARYEAAGGMDLLPKVTDRQVRLLGEALADHGDFVVEAGFRHSPPFIEDVAERLAGEVRGGVVLPLAPHYNSMSVAGYHGAARKGLDRLADAPPFRFVRAYPTHPLLVEVWADRLAGALDTLAATGDPCTVFTAHSLPARVQDRDDPYPDQVLQTCRAVADAAGAGEWRQAYQSAPPRGDWLGPDVLDALEQVHDERFTGVALAPVGFVADHMETRYDLDVEAKEKADELGLAWVRLEAPNDDARFIECLVQVTLGALKAA